MRGANVSSIWPDVRHFAVKTVKPRQHWRIGDGTKRRYPVLKRRLHIAPEGGAFLAAA